MYIIPIYLLFTLVVLIILVALDGYYKDKDTNVIHYVERIEGDKYITTCNIEIPIESTKVTTHISETTCHDCLRNTTVYER